MAKLRPPVSALDQVTGNSSASIILVEFGDYQCPHCGLAYPLVKKLLKEEGDHFLFVFRNFPLRAIHPAAFMAAFAAEAAGKQGKFWPMHGIIFRNQQYLHGNSFLNFGKVLEPDPLLFAQGLEDTIIKEKVEAEMHAGEDVCFTPDSM